MYIGAFTSRVIAYGESLPRDKLFILSAKYGLLEEDDIIEPYSITLKDMSDKQILMWANKVARQLMEKCDVKEDMFYILCGERYYRYLIDRVIKNYTIWMRGKRIGYKQSFLRERGF